MLSGHSWSASQHTLIQYHKSKVAFGFPKILTNVLVKWNFKQISIIDEDKNIITNHPYDKPFYIKIDYRVNYKISNSYIAFHVLDNDHNSILFGRDCDNDQTVLLKREPGSYQAIIKVPAPLLSPGNYRVSVSRLFVQNIITEKAEYICKFELLPVSINHFENELISKTWQGKIAIPLMWDVTIM